MQIFYISHALQALCESVKHDAGAAAVRPEVKLVQFYNSHAFQALEKAVKHDAGAATARPGM